MVGNYVVYCFATPAFVGDIYTCTQETSIGSKMVNESAPHYTVAIQ